MRIITNGTRDYYDTAGWENHDVMFMRAAYDEKAAQQQVWTTPFLWPSMIEHRENLDGGVQIRFGMCVLAGESHPFTRVRTWAQTRSAIQPVPTTTWIYDADEAIAAVNAVGTRRMDWLWGSGRYGSVETFMRTPRDALMPWALDNKAVTGILFAARPERWDAPRDLAHGMINCDGLGDRELFREVDPASAHMRIESFISGVLPQTQDLTVLSDASKARKAGFHDMSFKTRPGTKKPRGAKTD